MTPFALVTPNISMSMDHRKPSPRRLYEHWGCIASPVHDDDIDGINHAFNSTDTREALKPLEFWDNKVPGPGQYSTESILTSFKTHRCLTPYKTNRSRLCKPSTPGPGQYTANYGAIEKSQPFDDLLRKTPLNNLTPQKIRTKLIEREIHQIQHHKNQILQSLPIEKQKALILETKIRIQALLDEKSVLMATTSTPHTTNQTFGFCQSEERFFDPLDCSNTKYTTPSPGFDQDLQAHSLFHKSPALPTISKGKRDTLGLIRQQVYITSPLNLTTVGPGEYTPEVTKCPLPVSPTTVQDKPQLTIRLMNRSTKTMLPERMYLNQLVQDRARKRAVLEKQRDISEVQHLDEFTVPHTL
ncbi:hypothetical protein THRCLA_20692 [Thraustotheca clavata]|uniref:Uncharacterized protein n=1 Tax=Thraustotheca clavata TaxID=74557 RepID=A0A1W0A4K4_9STRA|nr:hypothetical protein THRCLA_20692 [Thraustotheca clavata]